MTTQQFGTLEPFDGADSTDCSERLNGYNLLDRGNCIIIVFALFFALSQFQPIFVSFVAISTVLCCCEEGLFHCLLTFTENQSTCFSY